MHTPNLLATLGILTLLTALIAGGVVLIRSIRVDLQRPTPPGSRELLRDLEAAYRKGQMDTAEFERVRHSLEQQKAAHAGSPAASAAAARRPVERTAQPLSTPSEPDRLPAAETPLTPTEGTTESAPEAG